jgi:hypothetical protein
MGSVINPTPLEPVSSYCPTSQCRFQDFTTLGACSKCESQVVDNDYFDECRYVVNDRNTTFHSLSDFQNELHQRLNMPSQDEGITFAVVGCDKYIDKDTDPGRDPQILLAIALEIQWPVQAQKRTPSTVTMQTKQFSKWGDRWYQAWEDNSTNFESEFHSPQILQIYSPSPATNWSTPYNISSQIEILSFYGFNSTTDLALYSDLEQVGVINGTMSLCQIEFCAHTHKDGVMENGRWSTSKVEETALNPTGSESVPNSTFSDPRKNFTYNAVGIADTFRIGILSFSPLERTIRTIFENEEFDIAMHSAPYNGTANGDWNIVSSRLAAVISSVVQSSTNPEARNFTGDSYGQEIFVNVRWIWLSGPLFVVFLSVVILILTIINSSRKQYLFKTSILAVLFHGLEGWNISDSQTEPDGRRKTDHELLQLAKGMRVSLRKNDEGSLKLKKE